MKFSLRVTLLVLAFALHGTLARKLCKDTKLIISKCYGDRSYQWLIQVPSSEDACKDEEVPPPISVECDFECRKGQAIDLETFKCTDCAEGTFSLGGGRQITFSESDNVSTTIPELTLKSTSFVGSFNTECKKKEIWRVKGTALQGEVQQNCAISLSMRFKLERAGSIQISYNLPTSLVFGTISSRCDFDVEQTNDDGDDDDNDDQDMGLSSKRQAEFKLKPTSYGSWKEHKIPIKEPGDYILSLFTFGVNAFHFPFSIRSIIIEGNAFLQDCIPCAPGTFADDKGSSRCVPCPKDTYTERKGSTECFPCRTGQYADEGSAKCLQKPKCEAKHYQKVFTGCDQSNMAKISYQPIQPQICVGPPPSLNIKPSPCGTCNPGMYKKSVNDRCEFCPTKTYSNGTLNSCLPCANDLSLVPGLYYKVWNEMPEFLTRSYMSFEAMSETDQRVSNQSWIPSIEYISSQAVADVVSVLTLTIAEGFRQTEVAKMTKEFGSLYFKFSAQCQSSCKLFLIAESVYNDSDNDWQIVNKWHFNENSTHQNFTEYKYAILGPEPIVFNWLFSSDDEEQGADEVRIYEIHVTNTQQGGSDRCVACLTTDDKETECKQCAPGSILANSTCIACPNGTIATRIRSPDPVPTLCQTCPPNTISSDGISCYVPCKQTFGSDVPYDLSAMGTFEFHGSKLFTQKGSGYFHVFNASICGKTTVTCTQTSTTEGSTSSRKSKKVIESKLCRIGSVPDSNKNFTSVAYIDEFGEDLVNVTLSTSSYFPALRTDYNLTDITLAYRANTTTSHATCKQRTTYLSLRCDYTLDDQRNKSVKYRLQTPSDCSTGTCDGCNFYFLLRTPLACPTCDGSQNGFRVFYGPCRFGRQEVRSIPHPYCAHALHEKMDTRRCSVLSTELQIVLGLFVIIAVILVALVVMCWRKNRKLEYRYMQLVENTNPDDDTPVDNVCAQISDEEDSGDEVHFKKPSKTKKIINVVRNAIRKNPNNEQSDFFNGDSFLLTSQSKDDA